MFDLNAIVNAAIGAAVQQATASLVERVAKLETQLAEAALFQHTTSTQVQLDDARVVEALNSQEWFWHKIASFVAKDQSLPLAADVAEHLSDAQLRKIAENLDPSELIQSVDFSEVIDYSEVASEIDLDDLADELDADGIAEKVDVEGAIREFFQNNTVSISI